MIDCDKTKEYISDYIEKNISPAIQSELNSHFEICEQCKAVLHRISKVKSLLMNMDKIQCSDDFNANLRHRIVASENKSFLSRESVRKTSYGLSFAVVLVLAVFGFNFFNQPDTESDIPLPQVENRESIQSSSSNINNASANLTTTEEMDVRTRDSEGVFADSLKNNTPEEKDPRVKYVDTK